MKSIHVIKGKTIHVESIEDLREFMDEEVYEALQDVTYSKEYVDSLLQENNELYSILLS